MSRFAAALAAIVAALALQAAAPAAAVAAPGGPQTVLSLGVPGCC